MIIIESLNNHMLVFGDGRVLITTGICWEKKAWDDIRCEITFHSLRDDQKKTIEIRDIHGLEYELGRWKSLVHVRYLNNRAWRTIYA